MKRRRLPEFEQPSLVPLADMLTNTVGIMLFILIFTTLGAGGAVIAKRLPKEKETDAHSLYVVCAGGKVVPFDSAEIVEGFMKPLGKPSFDTARAWAARFNERRFETADMIATGQAEANFTDLGFSSRVSFDVSLTLWPKPQAGEDIRALAEPDSRYLKWLSGRNPKEFFVFFFVRPDGVAIFQKARNEASARGFGAGWSPLGPEDKVQFSLSGQGRSALVQ